ncbi:MAG: DUF3256 family protein [Tannerellaceae bacterium]|jgi:hypothetical protein|nr:DUF3256 family protein [Tannerellaceae bacterium]
MKRISITITALALSAAIAAQDMKTLFTNMPDAYIPQLEIAWRKDLIDLFQSGKEARLKNTMNGYSQLWNLTDDYIRVQTTERSSIEIKLLPLVNNTYIICMVSTVEGPAPDSRLQFYTTDWQPLDARQMFTPIDADYFIKDDVDRESAAFKDAQALLDMDLIKYSLSPDNTNLTATYATTLYLSPTERAKVSPFLKDVPKTCTWEKAFFSK